MADTTHPNNEGALIDAPPIPDFNTPPLPSEVDCGEPPEESIFITVELAKQISEYRGIVKRALFGPFWSERELCILCGQTGAGKSALGLQIAIAIATGGEVGFRSECEASPVLYIDFENDVEDWRDRTLGIELPDNIYRASLDPQIDLENIASELNASIKLECSRRGIRAVIIDNISWLFSNVSGTDMHRETGALMKALNLLRQQEDLAILVVTHTNKDKGLTPFTLADVSGSSNVTRYAQSVVALASVSDNPQGRYLKQLKARGRAEVFNAHKVAAMELVHEKGFLHLARRQELDTRERDLLRDDDNVTSRIEEVKMIFKEHPSKTVAEVAKEMGVSERYVRKLKNQ